MSVRVGIVTTSFPRDAADPAGAFVAEHARWLRGQGHEVEVVSGGRPSLAPHPPHPPIPPSLHPPIAVVRVPADGLLDRGGGPEALEAGGFAWARAAVFSARMLAAVRTRARFWDRVFAHWLIPSAVCAAVATRRAPVAAIAHSGDVHLLCRTGLATPVAALLWARGATLSFVSGELRARLAAAVAGRSLRAFVDRSAVCPMGIDASRFERVPRTGPPTVLFVGRLVPVKGAQVLVDAARRLRSDAQVVIAGAGPMRAQLEQMNDQLGAGVRFAGALPYDRRHRVIASADVVVIPSIELASGRSEGLPVVALEAMAAGVPVVASTAGGLDSIPAAARARPGDSAALAVAIDRVLSAPPDVEGARAFARHLDWQSVGPRLDRLFLEDGLTAA